MSTDLAVIVVSWNVRDLLRRCLESLKASQQIEFLPSLSATHPSESHKQQPTIYRAVVVVVDNASSDGSAEMVRRDFPWVHLIASGQNLGFTTANNLAIRQLTTQVFPSYFLFLNPDTEVAPDALRLMLDYMTRHPEVGLLGPKLLNPDGTVQSSRRRFPTLATAFVESTVIQWRLWKDSPLLKRYYVLDRSDDETQEVDWVTGACFMVRREALENVGLMDEGFFMYSEELDWCRRMKEQGWKVVYLSAARVVHYGAQSSEQVKPFQHIQFQRSKIRYFRKYHGPLIAWALRLFLLASYGGLLLEEAVKWLITRRPIHHEQMKGYWQVVKSGL